jgi:hypothetical protein
MIRAVAVTVVIVLTATACSRTAEPPVTAKVDRIRVRTTGRVYVHLRVANTGDEALWVRSCVVRLRKPFGADVSGVLDVRSLTIVAPGDTEPLQGTVTDAGAPVTVGRQQNLMSAGPGPCVSGPDKASMIALPPASV